MTVPGRPLAILGRRAGESRDPRREDHPERRPTSRAQIDPAPRPAQDPWARLVASEPPRGHAGRGPSTAARPSSRASRSPLRGDARHRRCCRSLLPAGRGSDQPRRRFPPRDRSHVVPRMAGAARTETGSRDIAKECTGLTRQAHPEQPLVVPVDRLEVARGKVIERRPSLCRPAEIDQQANERRPMHRVPRKVSCGLPHASPPLRQVGPVPVAGETGACALPKRRPFPRSPGIPWPAPAR